MKKGLETLAAGNVIDSTDQLISPDAVGQVNDLLSEFFATDMAPADAQARFAEILTGDK